MYKVQFAIVWICIFSTYKMESADKIISLENHIFHNF